MAASIDVGLLDDEHEQRNDYRRANGSPLVSDPHNPGKTLRYRRPSSYGKPLDDDAALVEWRIWKSMIGVARSKALAAKVNACKDEDKVEKRALRDEATDKGAANESADMGTALHAMTVRWEDHADSEFDPPEQYRADLDAYWDMLQAYGLVSEHVEVHMVNDAYRAAGTADRIYRTTRVLVTPDGLEWPIGTLFLADLKTGQKLDFSLPGYCVQCAIYADGVFYDVHAECRMPTPEINRQWCLIVHLPVGAARCELLWVSVELGLRGALLAYDVKEWQNAWKAGRDGHDAVVVPAPAEPVDVMPLVEQADAALNGYIMERVRICGADPKARARLSQQWPSGVPTPKRGLSDPQHITQVLNLLDSIERDFSLPFTGGDPRTKGKHQSELPLSQIH
jgi:hypothetical protein